MNYKFKGKRIDNGEWVYGCHIEIKTPEGKVGHFIIPENVGEVDNDIPPMAVMFTLNRDIFMVNPDTLGQYIGFDDNIGCGIYDGDMLRATKTPRGGTTNEFKYAEVCWSKNYARFFICAYNDEKNIDKENKIYDVCADVIDGFGFEVIGNAYDRKREVPNMK